MGNRWLTIRTESFPPIRVGELRVTLHARVVCLRWPGRPAGLVWMRPGPVEVVTGTGERQWLEVRDVTREALVALAALCAAAGVWSWRARRPAR